MKQLFLKLTVLLTTIVGIFSYHDVMAQSKSVSGTVVDETGTPLIGMTVIITETTNGVTTDIDGKYQINVPSDGSLTFSYLGYKTQVIDVNGRTKIDVQL